MNGQSKAKIEATNMLFDSGVTTFQVGMTKEEAILTYQESAPGLNGPQRGKIIQLIDTVSAILHEEKLEWSVGMDGGIHTLRLYVEKEQRRGTHHWRSIEGFLDVVSNDSSPTIAGRLGIHRPDLWFAFVWQWGDEHA